MNKRTKRLFEDVTSLIWNELAMAELSSKACSRLSGKLGKHILQACKEAGLKFVPDTFSYKHTGKIPAQLFDSVWKAISSQIEEIDAEYASKS